MSAIVWSKKAKKDLQDIYEYIATESIYFAEKQIHAILERAGALLEQPTKGKPVTEYRNETVRKIFQGRYRIIYHIGLLPGIEILRVFHSARLLKL